MQAILSVLHLILYSIQTAYIDLTEIIQRSIQHTEIYTLYRDLMQHNTASLELTHYKKNEGCLYQSMKTSKRTNRQIPQQYAINIRNLRLNVEQ